MDESKEHEDTFYLRDTLCHPRDPHTPGFPTMLASLKRVAGCRDINHLSGLIVTIGANIDLLPSPASLAIRNSHNSLALGHALSLLLVFTEILCFSLHSDVNS